MDNLVSDRLQPCIQQAREYLADLVSVVDSSAMYMAVVSLKTALKASTKCIRELAIDDVDHLLAGIDIPTSPLDRHHTGLELGDCHMDVIEVIDRTWKQMWSVGVESA